MIACTDICTIFFSYFESRVNALCDVGRLPVKQVDYLSSMAVKAKGFVVITDTVYCITDYLFSVYLSR